MSEITITAKIQIIVPKERCASIDKTAALFVDACNYVSDYVYETHNLQQFKLQDATYDTLRSKYGLKSQMAISVVRAVIARYKAIHESQGEWIKPVFSKHTYDLVWNRDYSLTEGKFSVNTLDGRLKLDYRSAGMEKYFNKDIYRFGTAKLVHKHGKYFLHVPVTFDVEDSSLTDVVNVVGVDRGINFVITSYDSKHKTRFVDGRKLKQKRASFLRTRKQLQKVGTPSSRRRLKAIGGRETRWMHDVNHCVSKALVQSNPKQSLFVLEDLTGIRNVTEKVRLKQRYIQVSWSFYDLEEKIIYKSAIYGSLVVKVDPKHTSQTCPICGHTERSNRNKKLHLFCCNNCSYKSNDDRIGAMNLYRKGIEYLSAQVPDTVVI